MRARLLKLAKERREDFQLLFSRYANERLLHRLSVSAHVVGLVAEEELAVEELSKYRRVLDHFDAVKIGLTATPALHNKEVFGAPIFSCSHREAVVDGFLVDHDPPIRIVTKLAHDGTSPRSSRRRAEGERSPVPRGVGGRPGGGEGKKKAG